MPSAWFDHVRTGTEKLVPLAGQLRAVGVAMWR